MGGTTTRHAALLRIAGQTAPTGGFGLPADLLAKARSRVERFALVVFVAVTVASLITLFFWEDEHAWILRTIELVTIALSLGLFAAARSRLGHTTVLWLGLVYEVVQCQASALADMAWVYASTGAILSPIWVAVLVVAYPLIVPSPPRTTLVVALVSAATVPVGVAIIGAGTGAGFGPNVYVGATVQPAVAAVIAYFGSRVDGRADLYALGCVAYWLLTGTLVFSADTPMQMLVKHTSERPEPPSSRAELPIPEALDRLVLWCLEKKPEDRPPGARELAAQLRALPVETPWVEADAVGWWDRHRPTSEAASS